MSEVAHKTLKPTARIQAIDNPLRRPSLSSLIHDIQTQLADEWLPRIYRDRILTLRTRSYSIGPATKNAPVEVQHTLLGVELKIGRRRLQCPDFTHARYLAVFARLGCPEVAVPYDITKIARLADDLESAWHRMLLTAEFSTAQRLQSFRSRFRKALIARACAEINEAGAGERIPQFNQNTKQRPIPRHVA